ncbi:Uncharacterised protein [Burkholderia pseudomallei]|nr:Uncharacterised protein [Burkholderia pseudomallei]CAK0276061.1 Uncharacterised protein [Burkholderia pseudomallei]
MRRRTVKPCQPHIANDDQPKLVIWIFEPIRQPLASGFTTNMTTQRLWFAILAGHYDLHRTTLVVGIVPVWSQSFYRLIQARSDVPTHSHNHRLAFHRSTALFPMFHDECGHPLESLWRSYQSLQWDADLISDLFSCSIRLSSLLQLRFRNRSRGVVYRQLDDARFVVQRLRRPVFHCLTNVVYIGILAEDVNGVFVTTLQRGSCKADKGCVRKGFAHPPRTAFNKSVLTTVCLVGYHHHICAI